MKRLCKMMVLAGSAITATTAMGAGFAALCHAGKSKRDQYI